MIIPATFHIIILKQSRNTIDSISTPKTSITETTTTIAVNIVVVYIQLQAPGVTELSEIPMLLCR